ncbi:MAG: helix-turn-helix transcriptional regulator [Clostridiales bacterium]|jgi:transcriptional regulator with XRE-family HTH domain|nr:helix-turn-helix transcriptional regulator [Clostridiales bacterium]MDU6975691.1 helix-turn-helix transcriptional regulator [Clostridiales bacterium]
MKKTISERIKEGLKIRNMKQTDLVAKTGIGKSSISTYISGSYEPKQTNIYKIAKALDVNESWLMGYDVKMDRVITAKEINLTPSEKEHLEKYRALDDKGQHTVSTILDMEYNRCTNDHLMPMAAHSDNEDDLDLIRQDLDEL